MIKAIPFLMVVLSTLSVGAVKLSDIQKAGGAKVFTCEVEFKDFTLPNKLWAIKALTDKDAMAKMLPGKIIIKNDNSIKGLTGFHIDDENFPYIAEVKEVICH